MYELVFKCFPFKTKNWEKTCKACTPQTGLKTRPGYPAAHLKQQCTWTEIEQHCKSSKE